MEKIRETENQGEPGKVNRKQGTEGRDLGNQGERESKVHENQEEMQLKSTE